MRFPPDGLSDDLSGERLLTTYRAIPLDGAIGIKRRTTMYTGAVARNFLHYICCQLAK